MSEMTASEFQQWQHHFITQEYFIQVKDQIEGMKDALSGSAGLDPTMDNFRRGYIAAMYNVLQFHVNLPTEEEIE
jgi:hypothetical protein